MISGFNKHIACEPLRVSEDAEKTEKTGVRVGEMRLKMVSQRVQLVPLKVIFGTDDGWIRPGDYVYVTQAGTHQVGMTSQWTKSIDIDLGDGKVQEVVMVPHDSIQLVNRIRPEA